MEYRFRPLTKNCAGTGLPLVPGAACYSVLVERHGQQERLDFSEEGWKGVPADAVGFWRCHVPVMNTPPVAVTDPEVLMKTLEQLLEAPNPLQEKLSYVLSLTLLHKRRLKLDGTQTIDGKELLELSGTRGEGPFLVRDQHLSEVEITELRRALEHQMQAGWEAA